MEHRAEGEGGDYLAERLRRAWRESGLKQREIVRRSTSLNDPSYLSRALNGKETLSLAALQSVAEVLDLDYRELLREAGLDEETYRSRHSKAPKVHRRARGGHQSVRAILTWELEQARRLKYAGRPGEALGAIGAVRRVITRDLGGLPGDRETVLAWAALLLEHVGIVQDVQLPHTILRTAQEDLDDIATIAREYDAEDLGAVAHFYAGDAHYKDLDFTGAISHYEAAVTHAPTAPLRARSLAGWAICLARVRHLGDSITFDRLRSEALEALSSGEGGSLPAYIRDSEQWLVAALWVQATLARSLVLLGRAAESTQALDAVEQRYRQATLGGFTSVPFEMSIAQLRFLAGCRRMYDMSGQDIVQLGFGAYALAQEGSSPRPQREIESLMLHHFGLHVGAGSMDVELL